MTDRFCSECKNFSVYGDCIRNAYTIRDPVMGDMLTRGELRGREERKPIGVWDYIARLWGVYRCGPEGVFWEAKK